LLRFALEVMLGFMGEFDLIETFFKRPARNATLGVGDDCALLPVRAGQQLAISSDMLVEGRHFLSTVNPRLLGHKALAVNLSDLAACGAEPKAFMLALALPEVNALHGCLNFQKAFGTWPMHHQCDLIGGDTTRGPLNICITVLGEVPAHLALLRSGAKVGDDIYVSGHLGDARLALEGFRGRLSVRKMFLSKLDLRMEMPTPRLALGQALRGIATAAADISDGLLGDLQHILKASGMWVPTLTQPWWPVHWQQMAHVQLPDLPLNCSSLWRAVMITNWFYSARTRKRADIARFECFNEHSPSPALAK
jgi:thiamine-monophosphate kinase